MNTSKTDHNMMNGWNYWYLVQGSKQVPYCIKSKWNMMHVPTRIYSLSWGNVIKPGRASEGERGRERERVVAIECFPKLKIKSSLLHRWVAVYWNETTGDTAHVPACVWRAICFTRSCEREMTVCRSAAQLCVGGLPSPQLWMQRSVHAPSSSASLA